MKIYAIPKTQTNTYVPDYQQNSSINTNYISTKNMSANNYASKINFCGILKKWGDAINTAVEQLEKKVSDKADAEEAVTSISDQIEATDKVDKIILSILKD